MQENHQLIRKSTLQKSHLNERVEAESLAVEEVEEVEVLIVRSPSQ